MSRILAVIQLTVVEMNDQKEGFVRDQVQTTVEVASEDQLLNEIIKFQGNIRKTSLAGHHLKGVPFPLEEKFNA